MWRRASIWARRNPERAVEKGLQYLAAHQLADGHWASGGYTGDVAITGLSLLAFLAAGHQPGRGRYGLVLNEAVDFLAKSVRMNGQFGATGLVRSDPSAGQSGQPMYGHGFATLALAEVYGMTHRRDLKPKVEAAIHLIEDTQNIDGQPRLDGEMSAISRGRATPTSPSPSFRCLRFGPLVMPA